MAFQGEEFLAGTFTEIRWADPEGWEVDYIWEPFGVVSGDHIDLLRPSSTSDPLHLVLGDVAGKGFAASLLQSQLHALFRALTSLPHVTPNT